ncbi:MAG: hypothetical protein LBU06_06405 [Desulfovibrio sp.]|nr:hypothetical protein [Desulfovibrio sp.]
MSQKIEPPMPDQTTLPDDSECDDAEISPERWEKYFTSKESDFVLVEEKK